MKDVQETRTDALGNVVINIEVSTTDDTETDLWSEEIDEGEIWDIDARIVGVAEDDAEAGSYDLRGTVSRAAGGTAAAVGDAVIEQRETDADWSVGLDVDTNDVNIVVEGKAATNIDWRGTIRIRKQEIAASV